MGGPGMAAMLVAPATSSATIAADDSWRYKCESAKPHKVSARHVPHVEVFRTSGTGVVPPFKSLGTFAPFGSWTP
ncbi:hypothetical protein N7468_002526 [Penicillium chermesinum]|uniref:Uncharacterized protein n=1 Tax=Penicillium chermesinum TaxID=63820 RepID=A0A9W9PKT7_9EURO|nr:uncharacterized protein N7468_002526 [Penicillium chermesinum]KAJ5247543.1 hypothetical protein N7468_002526 [Penicillium chermesinum]